MIDDQFTPEDQQTTQQLSAAPKPKLAAAAREAIRQQMLNEFRATTNALPQRQVTRPLWRVAAFAAAVTVIAIGFALAQTTNRQAATLNSTTLTAAENRQTGVMPTVTPALTIVVALPTEVQPSPTLTAPEETSAPAPTLPLTIPSATLPAPTQLLSATFTATTPIPTQPASATLTPTLPIIPPTSTLPEGNDTIVIIEGPITNIGDDTVSINDFTIKVAPNNPILGVIDVGDTVHIEGNLDSTGIIVADVVSNVTEPSSPSSTPVTVGLDGPIESINGTEIVVNSVTVRLDPNDLLVGKLHIGDFVRVQGNFEGSGATTVLVVVNITIVSNVIVNGIPTCRYDVDAMGMGHWHCDGIGMGDPAMGMGDDGMGNPAMGTGDDGMGDPAMGMGDDGMSDPAMGMGG
ncbi:MAG: DUF5666 domain-containing protein [Chloroflexota bacterium]